MPKRVAAVSLTPADGRFSLATPNILNAGLQLRAVPNRYYVVPSFAAGYCPDSVTLAGLDVLGQAVDLVPGSPPIQVSYKPARGSVRGKVDNPASTIVLVPEQITTIGFGRMAQAKADGTFEIAGVAPGATLSPLFWESISEQDWIRLRWREWSRAALGCPWKRARWKGSI